MNDVPTTPVPPAPAPTPYVHWAALREFVVSLGSLPVWHVCKSGGTGVGKGLWYAAGCLPYVASAAFLLWLAHQQGCTLPIPVPVPPAPVPVDPLTQSMHAAYVADPDPAKADHAAKLATILSTFVPAARSSGNVKTLASLDSTMKDAVKISIGADTLPALRKAVGDHLNAKLPTTGATPMTDQLWLAADADFKEIAAAITKGAK